MKKAVVGSIFLLLTGLMSGCSVNHPVAKDYPQYLAKNSNAVALPKAGLKSDYSIDGKTQDHRYEFRAATVGYAHLWIVEFGKILEETLHAQYVQASFGHLARSTAESSNGGNLISFSLETYEFKDYRAYVSMRIKFASAERTVIDKLYSVEGESRGGQMWAAGVFGMKDATLDSTKSAIDKILAQFINDIPKS
jgi:hypothetical protein